MIDIQEYALNTYRKNLLFLEKNDKQLYSRINALSDAISSGEYNERYHLEYIKEEEQFDIYDSNNNCYLYDKQPNKFINTALENCNFDKVGAFNLLDNYIYNLAKPLDSTYGYGIEVALTNEMFSDIRKYISIFKKSTVKPNKKFKSIDKFIFIGTLLGTHILPIHTKLKATSYLIFENNLEIFRLSLFTTKYFEIDNSLIIFSIMEDQNYLRKKFEIFYKKNLTGNYQFKYYCTNYNIGNAFDLITTNFSAQDPFAYKYTKIISGLLKLNMQNIPNHFVLTTKCKYNLFENSPVLLLAAGPSLQKNIQWIYENKEKYTLVAIGATMTTLIKYNILPDLIVTVDPDIAVEKHFTDEVLSKITDIPILASSATDKTVLDKFEKTILFEVMGSFKQTSVPIAGFSVTEVTLFLSALFGASDIYMIGSDFALDQETGASHTDEHLHNRQFELSKDMLNDNLVAKNSNTEHNNSDSIISVKGNFREKVITTMTFEKSIAIFPFVTQLMNGLNNNIKIYNLSDGAYLAGTIPLNFTNINNSATPKKVLTAFHIYNYLHKYSTKGFTEKDKQYLLSCVKVIKKIIVEIKKLKTLQCYSYPQFVDQRALIFKMIITDLEKYKHLFAKNMYYNYLSITEPYFGYHFNDLTTLDIKIIKAVKNEWIKQMLAISNKYKNIVEKALL